jgi:hypothetical protein
MARSNELVLGLYVCAMCENAITAHEMRDDANTLDDRRERDRNRRAAH